MPAHLTGSGLATPALAFAPNPTSNQQQAFTQTTGRLNRVNPLSIPLLRTSALQNSQMYPSTLRAPARLSPALKQNLGTNQGKTSQTGSTTALRGSFWPDSDYPDTPVKTPLQLSFQPLGQSAYPVYSLQLPHLNPEFPNLETADTAAIDLTKLLASGTVYLSFSDNDVHMGEITQAGDLRKLSIPDCPLSKAQLKHTDGADQSGLYFVPSDMPTELRAALYEAAQTQLTGQKPSNLKAITAILTQAGCHLNTTEQHLTECDSISKLLQAILTYGLAYQGAQIPARFINTTTHTLQQLKAAMDHSALSTPFAHFKQLTQTQTAKEQRSTEAAHIRATTPEYLLTGHQEDPKHPIEISTAKTSPTGALLRRHISPHILFSIQLNNTNTEKFLPSKLKPFDQKNPDLITRIKKDVLFPPSMAKKINNLMADSYDGPTQITGPELLSLLANQGLEHAKKYNPHHNTNLNNNPAETQQETQRYNCVITDNNLKLGQLKTGCEAVDDVLSKHVLLAEYEDVRFAGELYVKDNTLYLTRNSGTYRPTETHLEKAVSLLRKQFPTLTVKGDFEAPY